MKQQTLLASVVVVVVALVGLLAWWGLAGSPEAAGIDSTRTTTAARRVDMDAATMPVDVALAGESVQRNVLAPRAATPGPDATPALPPSVEDLLVRVVSGPEQTPVVGASLTFAEALDPTDGGRLFRAWFREGELDRNLAAQIEPLPVRTVTDVDGRVRVPYPQNSAVVVAAAEGLWGYRVFDYDVSSPLILELHLNHALDVDVVDTRGMPVSGALVALRTRHGHWHEDRIVAPTGHDGRATLQHAGYILATQTFPSGTLWKVGLAAVLSTPVEVEIDPSEPPIEAVQLVLPATGTCVVYVQDARGRDYPDEVSVGLRVLERNESLDPNAGERVWGRSLTLPHVHGGIARFEHVEPGRALEVTVERRGSSVDHRVRGLGPTVAGSEAVMTVVLGEAQPVLAGRVLDSSGNVLANTALRSRVHHADWTGNEQYSWDVRTDAEGRFEVDAEPDDRASLQLTVFSFARDGTERESATRDLPPGPEPGLHELGDFTLQPSPILASGIVVDGAGEPVPGATVTPAAKQFWGTGDNGFWWQEVFSARGKCDATGKFELRGRVVTTQLRLVARSSNHQGEPVFVAPGASELVLKLVTTGSIAGRVLLDPGVPRDALVVGAHRDDDEDPGHANEYIQPSKLDAEGRFELTNLRPGSYEVSLYRASGWPQIARFADVRVAASGVTRDARLDPLDLRGKLSALAFDIVDEAGRPIVEGALQWSTSGRAHAEASSLLFNNGRCALFYTEGPLDVVVSATGYRTAVLKNISNDQRVVLRAGIEVQLSLAPGLRAPEPPYFLGVLLVPKENGLANQEFTGHDEANFDSSGKLVLFSPIAGKVEVHLTLKLQTANLWMQTNLHPHEPQVIEIADVAGRQSFELRFAPEALENTLEVLRDDL